MGISRYPRRGQRLAPTTLAELLRLPIGRPLPGLGETEALRLCDLDESVWERFDEATCRALAEEVVRAVAQAARRPMPIAERTVPSLPAGLRLTDLELETRTLNCLVAAGLHARPQDLQAMTLEGILSLPGFWVKCLVDLLTSVEHVTAHPEARRALKQKRSVTPLPAARTACRYPRPGFRLAPATLQEILQEPIAAELVAGTPLEGKRLCDLDERVWEAVDAARIEQLAELVLARVTISGYNRAIQERPLPKVPKGLQLDDLRLENRTFNCLRRAGLAKRPEDLARRTVGDLLELKAFGAKCLVDLLVSLETLHSRQGKLDERITAEAQALAEVPGAKEIHFSDPRLGPRLRELDAEANTVGELVQNLLRRRVDPPDPLRVWQAIAEVRRQLELLIHLSLEEELSGIFAPPGGGRDAEIVVEYYGWDGCGGHTLEELGRKYGLSRERIRQVCVRAVKRCRGCQVFAPALDRALAFLEGRVPCEASQLKAEFAAAGFSRQGISLQAVQEAAGFLGRSTRLALIDLGERALLVRAEQAELPRAIQQAARRVVLSYGAATIAEVAAELTSQGEKLEPTLIQETLKTLPDFQWLDESRGWFQLESLPQYGLPNLIEKVLSVAPRIEVGKLRSAIARYRRTGRSVPPPRALLEFCRGLSGVRVEGNRIVATPPRDWETVLSGVEASMVRILHEHGPILERGVVEEYCLDAGMNRFSFNAIVMCSPVICQYGRSVYGLIGTKVDRKRIDLLAARKSEGLPTRVLCGFGQTEEGQVYLSYRLSKAAISGGVITVPAAMKETVRGSFTLRTREGDEAGTLVSKSGCAWGLGPVLRSQKARPGDQLVLVFDAQRREAEIRLGEEAELEALAVQG